MTDPLGSVAELISVGINAHMWCEKCCPGSGVRAEKHGSGEAGGDAVPLQHKAGRC